MQILGKIRTNGRITRLFEVHCFGLKTTSRAHPNADSNYRPLDATVISRWLRPWEHVELRASSMSRLYSSGLWSGTLGSTKDITGFVQVSLVAQDIYEEAGFGGSADIFSGKYINPDGAVVKTQRRKVAIKSIRAFNIGKNEDARLDKLQKKLARELKVWRALSGGANIIELLGIMNGIGPLPSF
ncbi:unnamed protein product, partial [Rhizoctonia solani]